MSLITKKTTSRGSLLFNLQVFHFFVLIFYLFTLISFFFPLSKCDVFYLSNEVDNWKTLCHSTSCEM